MTKQELIILYQEAKRDGDREAMKAAAHLLRRLNQGQTVEKPMELRRDEPTGLGLARQAAQGASFGFADEAEAALDPSLSVEDVRATNREYAQENPGKTLAAQMAGGAVTGFGTGGLAARGLSGMAPWLQSLLIGAGEGGLAGLGGSERQSIGDTLSDVGAGATVGGVIGLGSNAAANAIPWTNKGSQARVAAEQMRRGMTPDQARKELEALNAGFPEPWAMGADLNPAATQAAYSAMPKNAPDLEQALRQRQRAQGPLLEQTVRKTTGVDEGRVAASQELLERRRAEGREMYAPLRGESVTVTPAMEQTLRTPSGKTAAERTLRSMRDTSGNPELELDDVKGSFDFWHAYQQVLRDMGKNKLASAVPLSTPEAMAVLGRQKQVMDDLFGQADWGNAYREATERYRENSRLMEALTDSEAFGRLKRDEVERAVGRLGSEEERKAFAAGVVNDLIEKVMRSPDGADMATKLVRTPALRQNLEVVLGEEVLGKLDDQMQRLARMTKTKNMILEGSPTSPREAANDIIAGGGDSGGALTDLLNLQFGTALRKAFGGGGQKRIPEDLAERMVDAAVRRDPASVINALAELERLAAMRRDAARFGVMGAGIGATGPQEGGF